MNTLLKKEMQLSALLLTYLFIGFGFMTLVPGYPILCGVFFVCLGIYQSFQSAREANDIIYSALLPVAKRDVVRGKYQFVMFIELCSFALMAVLTILRMTLLSNAAVYRQNFMMNANPFYLGTVLVLFSGWKSSHQEMLFGSRPMDFRYTGMMLEITGANCSWEARLYLPARS